MYILLIGTLYLYARLVVYITIIMVPLKYDRLLYSKPQEDLSFPPILSQLPLITAPSVLIEVYCYNSTLILICMLYLMRRYT